jgi:hypothetical protein
MRARNVVIALLLTSSATPWAQAPAPAERAESQSAPLPVRRVVLYKTGVGYFEHLGSVRDRQDVAIRFTSAQLNDVLKSLTTLDLGKGNISGISYNSIAPMEQRLGALRLSIGAAATTFDLLASLRGARVEVVSGAATIEGRLLSVEQRSQVQKDQAVQMQAFSIVTDGGEMRTFDLTPAVRIRIVDRDLRQEVARYLDVVGSSREQDVRRMVISTSGAGDRQLFVSYISEVPIWKSTYRLVLRDKGKPLLQGWAIIDNTVGEDWTNVELSLVAGAPQSFIQQISQPYYGRRPVVPLPSTAQVTPQTHQAALTAVEEKVSVTADALSGSAGGRPERTRMNSGVVGGVVGGLPAPPAPAAELRGFEQAQNLQPVAQGMELGDLFEYRIKEPVTLRKNQSALVPIVNAEIAAEKVVLWNRPVGSGRPLRAVWLSNATGYTLDGGNITVIDANAFAGEGLVEPLKPGERRLVSYAAELGVLVSAKQEAAPGRVTRLRVNNGIIMHDMEERSTSTYTARNENVSPVTLVVEHRLRPGWKLAGNLTPAETTPDSHRFRVTLDPGKAATLEVREVHPTQTTISITELTDHYIAAGMRTGFFAEDLQRILKPVIDKRVEIAAVDRQIEQLRSQQDGIITDQQRLRENMKALRGSAEEKQLLQRYTRQLDDQENRLEALRRELARSTERRETLRAELSSLIETLSFETGGH